MIHGETKMLRRRCPDVKTLRVLVEQATGMAMGSQKRLAEMIGCKPKTVRAWERGQVAVSPVFIMKLIEVETSLRSKITAHEKEKTPTKAERPLPLMANAMTVRVEGEQALVRFSLKVPGEENEREVAEVLVPKGLLKGSASLNDQTTYSVT